MKKIITLLCLLIASAAANAQDGPNNRSMRENMFNQFKQLHVNGIQQRISILQNNLGCVQNAQKHEDLKACEETTRQAMENLKQSQQQKMQALQQTMQQERQQHQQHNEQGAGPQSGMNPQHNPGPGSAPGTAVEGGNQ